MIFFNNIKYTTLDSTEESIVDKNTAGSLEAEPPGYRQHHGCIIPQAVTHSLMLLKMRGINA